MPGGTATAVVGPDGVGKSTLLALIAGVERMQAGHPGARRRHGRQRAHRERVAPRIAYMPQGLGRNLYPTLSVVENIDFFGSLFGLSRAERRARIDRLLRATGLHPFPDRPAGKLSGGMRQKLVAVLRPDPRSRPADPGRADDRRRSAVAPAVLAADRRHQGRAARHDRAGRHRLYGGGRALRTAGRHGCRAASWPGHTARCSRRTGRAIAGGGLHRAAARGHKAQTGQASMPPRAGELAARRHLAEGLTRRFGDFTAVDHVSFRIERGEIFGFLGSNGCGKTTTMKMLTGLLASQRGTGRAVRPAGRRAGDIETRMRVGYMSQSSRSTRNCRSAPIWSCTPGCTASRPARAAAANPRGAGRFDLAASRRCQPDSLPLGIRQRLQLGGSLPAPARSADPGRADLGRRPGRTRHVLAAAGGTLAARRGRSGARMPCRSPVPRR